MKTCFSFLLASFVATAPVKAVPKPVHPAFEPRAHAILKKTFDHYRGLRSYMGTTRWTRSGTSLNVTQQSVGSGQTISRVSQPKIFLSCHLDVSDLKPRYFDDGQDFYINILPDDVMHVSHFLLKQDDLWQFADTNEFGIRKLLQGENPLEPFGAFVKSIVSAPERNKNEAHVVVRLEGPKSTAQIDYFIGQKDLSLRSMKVHQVVNNKTLDLTEEYTDIKFNPSFAASEIEPDAETKKLADENSKIPSTPPSSSHD